MPGIAAILASAAVQAQFAAAVSPPRFEIDLEPGQVSRQVIEIAHALPGSAAYRVYTADWSLDAAGTLAFQEPLQPGSCRPWVAIERRDLTVAAGARVRFRFEVSAPADAAPQECRFALMIESRTQEVQAASSSFPMNGRIGVIVYARVSGARPVLSVERESIGTSDGRLLPVLVVRNDGNATGRLSGIVKGRDGGGATAEFTPEALPILPGRSRRIALQPHEPAAAAASPAAARWPLAMRGALEYDAGGRRIEIDHAFSERDMP
jgi:hypothetical protein